MSQLQPVGIFEHHQDIGQPAVSGSAEYDSASQTYRITAAGENMWFDQDQFHFAWKKIKGDFIMRATIEFVGEGVAAHRKIGIIARDKLTASSRYADACVHGDELTALQYRLEDGSDTQQETLSVYHPTDIMLERQGDIFTFSAAVFGETLKSVSRKVELSEEVYAGLFVCSHVDSIREEAIFRNVRIVIPADPDFRPYQDFIGSRLEIMDVTTGHRKVLHSEPHSIQAPNWTPDGKHLIYNSSDGKLFRYGLQHGIISGINTGTAGNNNNDHVLSFDGKQLGLSHWSTEGHISTIYRMPVSGSDSPEQVTSPEWGHSFLHGFSPDGTGMIYTANRNDAWNIWEVDVRTRKETRLTDTPTLDDGPEYTPDGKYIYFNSARTGTMQIWRMKPDGSEPRQITFDAYNDWFPHISPDGKWIVYLSFPADIDPLTHPFYKHVYLRLMPAEGGVPKTIAYIYGGQGTINVPSWSPDSKQVAFISNSKL